MALVPSFLSLSIAFRVSAVSGMGLKTSVLVVGRRGGERVKEGGGGEEDGDGVIGKHKPAADPPVLWLSAPAAMPQRQWLGRRKNEARNTPLKDRLVATRSETSYHTVGSGRDGDSSTDGSKTAGRDLGGHGIRNTGNVEVRH